MNSKLWLVCIIAFPICSQMRTCVVCAQSQIRFRTFTYGTAGDEKILRKSGIERIHDVSKLSGLNEFDSRIYSSDGKCFVFGRVYSLEDGNNQRTVLLVQYNDKLLGLTSPVIKSDPITYQWVDHHTLTFRIVAEENPPSKVYLCQVNLKESKFNYVIPQLIEMENKELRK